MKFQVTQKNLNNCLKNVALFADKGHQLDITKNIVLKTQGNLLEVSATNLEVSIVEKLQGSCKKGGDITIPAGVLKDYIQNLPFSEDSKKVSVIDLEVRDKKQLKITYNQTQAQVNGLPFNSDNYPVFTLDKKQKPFFQAKAEDFKSDLNQVIFAANKDISRPILTGVFMHAFKGEFYLAATDSYRLAEKRIAKHSSAPSNAKQELQLLLPAQNLLKIERVLSSYPDKKVSLYKEDDKKYVLFVLGDGEIEIISSLIQGTYPNYRRLLPEESKTKIVVDTEELLYTTKQIKPLTSEAFPSISFSWQNGKTLNVKSIDSMTGNYESSLSAKIKTEDKEADKSITLNAQFLQEALQAIASPQIELTLNSRLQPCILQGLNGTKKDDDYRHAIMPLNVNSPQ